MTTPAPGTMQTATAVEKQQFENQSGGFVGAVQIDATGKSAGVAVAPGGRVWLSHAEQVLTANAPQDPRHNPFLPQVFQQIDLESGERRDVTITPLKPVTDQRYVPASERFVPAEQPEAAHAAEAAAAAREEEPVQVTSASDPVAETEAAVEAAGTDREVPAPSARAQAAAEAAAGTETAQAGEETGAAVPPAQDAEKGQYAPGEEVGTPEAPAAAPAEDAEAETPAGPPTPPAPWTPGSSA